MAERLGQASGKVLFCVWAMAQKIGIRMQISRASTTLRTLFVEDSHYLRDVIGDLLQEEGLSVISCATADEAEVEFRREPFKLLITDVNRLPVRTGSDLAKSLLSISPNTWVVFLSCYALGGNLMEIGKNVRALRKPFEVESLQALLQEIRNELAQP